MRIPSYANNDDDEKKVRNEIFELPARILIAGPSGSGKSTLVVHFIRKFLIPYNEIRVYTKNPHQLLFENLKNVMSDISKKMGNQVMDILSPNEISKTTEFEKDDDWYTTCIFDDLINYDRDTLRKISSYFIKGRHRNLSLIFLTQSYHHVPQDIHLNTNYMIIYPPLASTHSRLIEGDNDLEEGTFDRLGKYESILIDKINKRKFKNLNEKLVNN